MKSWKASAIEVYRKVVKLGLWTDELADRNYSGAGGVVHPNGTFLRGISANDVGWEQLYSDCVETLRSNLVQ